MTTILVSASAPSTAFASRSGSTKLYNYTCNNSAGHSRADWQAAPSYNSAATIHAYFYSIHHGDGYTTQFFDTYQTRYGGFGYVEVRLGYVSNPNYNYYQKAYSHGSAVDPPFWTDDYAVNQASCA